MKPLLASVLAIFVVLTISVRAASDADVTPLKVKKVVIEEGVITITVAEAKTRITLIRDDYDPKYTGDNWHGMPVTRVEVISNKATFTIRRDRAGEPGGVLAKVWEESLKAAKDLQEGKEMSLYSFWASTYPPSTLADCSGLSRGCRSLGGPSLGSNASPRSRWM